MKRYNKETEKFKKLYFKPYEVLKSYIFASILAIAIALIIYLPLLNLLFLTRYFKIIIVLIVINTLFGIYLLLYFKDKALETYNSDAKNVNLFYIRIVDTAIVSFFVIIILIIMIFCFGW